VTLRSYFGLSTRFLKRSCTALLILFAIVHSVSRAAEQSTERTVFDVVRFDQRMGEQLPLDVMFRDHTGKKVALREFFGKRPVILNLVYYQCPMLCTISMNGMVRGLRPLTLGVGKDFDILTISFDPSETQQLAAAKRQTYLKEYGRPSAEKGWHFLIGEQRAIDQVCEAVGFHYVYDKQTRQFAHPGGLVILTPEGKVARYLFDVEYAPRDLRLSLVEASNRRIGSPTDRLLLMCYGYDPAAGKYALVVMNVIRVTSFLTVAAIGTFVGLSIYREKKKGKGGGSIGNQKVTYLEP